MTNLVNKMNNNDTKLFADNQGNIHITFREKPEINSVLGKRKIVDAFGLEIYNDKDRYGQDISNDFFNNHIGHNSY